jgi:acetyl coenzyme A synthetase (ADP forming)-like protein
VTAATTPPTAGRYPSDWEFDLLLKDCSTAHLRPIRPDDAAGLADLVARMSRESIYHRFFRVRTGLTDAELEAFTVLDYRDRMAFVVETAEDASGGRSIAGVGRYERSLPGGDAAEVAFSVADESQGRGVASRILEYLTAYARTQGISAFEAYVMADNHAMIRVFRGAGFTMSRQLDEGVYRIEFPTEESDETRAATEEHEKRAAAASVTPLLYPTSVAVIGASRDPESIGGRLLANLLAGDFTGPVYPVNPKATVVRSMRAYASVLDIEDRVDLAVIVVPAPFVMEAVRQCAAKGVKGLVVISAGFSETGEDGRRLEQELLTLVRAHSMRMIGPNCMGVVNTDPAVRLDAQFGPVAAGRGNVAMSSQSGALGIAILDHATRIGLGISSFVSVGNKADVSGNDLLLYWEDDPATDVILLYLESFGNPRRFARIARRIARKKPIVAVKSGRTAAGARAAGSHTGSLASRDVAVDALFRQAGVIRTDTLGELFDVTAVLANQPLPAGRRVAVVSNAGGPAILAVDTLESLGLSVPELSEGLKETLRANLSSDASVGNPVDMIAAAGPDEYRASLGAVLASDEVDAVLAIYIPTSVHGAGLIAAAIAETAAHHHRDKTFLAVYMDSSGTPPDVFGRIPVYLFPEQAARALARAVDHAEWVEKPTGSIVTFDDVDPARARAIVAEALAANSGESTWLEPERVEEVLGCFGISVPRSAVVATEDEAAALAAGLGGPVVLKVISPSALHKSDVGGVALDVSGEDQVRSAYREVTAAVPDPEGVLVQEFIAGGHEVLIGITQDPNFGRLVVFGMGGVFVELIRDVAFRIHPLTDLDAREMLGDVRSSRLLEGYRGGDAGDIEALIDVLLRVSAMVEAVPELVEMDMNPVKVRLPGQGVCVVDARIRVEPAEVFLAPEPGLRMRR